MYVLTHHFSLWTIMKSSSLPSLNLSSMMLTCPLSECGYAQWHMSHAAMDQGTMREVPNLPLSEDFGIVLSLPTTDDLASPVPIPNASGGTTSEFSFRNAWEATRQMQELPHGFRHIMARWEKILADEGLSMDEGTKLPRGAAKPPLITTHRRERQGLVRHNGRLCRCPSSAWTSHAGLDPRVRWAD